MYTVRQVADLAGVTPRTLHHYDSIGLLKPTSVGGNGYRQYGEEALLRLQQILLYREMGMDLDAIKRLLAKKDFSVVKALEAHRSALTQRIERLRRLVETVERTIASQKGEKTMQDKELFEGLTEQEQAYAEEAMDRWDPAVVKESNRRYGRLTAAEKQAMKDAGEALNRDWAKLIGSPVDSPAVKAVVARWKKGLEFFYTPTPEILVGLAEMYVADDRFKANFDRHDPRLAAYVVECVKAEYGR